MRNNKCVFGLGGMSMTENECIVPNNQVLDDISKKTIAEAIQEAIDDNKPRIANVAVANFDGSIAYTLQKRVGGRL